MEPCSNLLEDEFPLKGAPIGGFDGTVKWVPATKNIGIQVCGEKSTCSSNKLPGKTKNKSREIQSRCG